MKLEESFKNQVNLALSGMRVALPLQEIEARLRKESILEKSITSEKFVSLFQSYLSALISHSWNLCCRENAIESKDINNLFFKTVLDEYSEKKDLEGASHFSEALYAANSHEDQEPLISILAAFFKKMGASESLTGGQISLSFRWMAEIWEGYRNSFDNEFDDFIAQLRMRDGFSKLKRG